MLHRIYLSPGMFGFGRLASFDYFAHVERALTARIRAAGEEVETHVVHVSPTSSIRRRAARLAELVASTSGLNDPASKRYVVHLVGHSTGGLDARLLASPDVVLAIRPDTLAWIPRLASVTTLNAPHYGTPLASFFTTVSGQRMLQALTALTFIALSVGSTPLSAVSALVVAFGRIDHALGLDLKVIDRTTDSLVRVLDDARSKELRSYIDDIKADQGAMVQLMPEAMDLFAAGISDRATILYQSTASMAPPPSAGMFARVLTRPMAMMSSALFALLHGITSRSDDRYPCAAATAGVENEACLERVFNRAPGARANDGVVPLRSQIWGKLVWAGYGDHLDVLGHFHDTSADSAADLREGAPPHVDWLSSGSRFDRKSFDELMDSIVKGLLESGRAV
jgi:triacylglycerol lipase